MERHRRQHNLYTCLSFEISFSPSPSASIHGMLHPQDHPATGAPPHQGLGVRPGRPPLQVGVPFLFVPVAFPASWTFLLLMSIYEKRLFKGVPFQDQGPLRLAPIRQRRAQQYINVSAYSFCNIYIP